MNDSFDMKSEVQRRSDPLVAEMCKAYGHPESNSWPGECICGKEKVESSVVVKEGE